VHPPANRGRHHGHPPHFQNYGFRARSDREDAGRVRRSIALQLAARTRITELVAKKIIDVASNGERDAVKICEQALRALGIARGMDGSLGEASVLPDVTFSVARPNWSEQPLRERLTGKVWR
jgi:hypothetical protein